jgi:hypothetical protein
MEKEKFLGVDFLRFEFVFLSAFDSGEPQEYFNLYVSDWEGNSQDDSSSDALFELDRYCNLAIKLGYEPIGCSNLNSYAVDGKHSAIAWQTFRLKELAHGAREYWGKYRTV